jgi:hypothetical protein
LAETTVSLTDPPPPGDPRITVHIDEHDQHPPGGRQTMSGFDINQLAISGNLTRDPKLLRFDDGSALCKLRIANNDRTKNLHGEWINRPQFFNVTIWAGIGEWVADNLHNEPSRIDGHFSIWNPRSL